MKETEFKKEADRIRENICQCYSQTDPDQMPFIGMIDMLIESILLLTQVIGDYDN